MITRRALAQQLGKAQLAAWTVIEREQTIAIADDARDLRRDERATRFTVIVHRDVPRGRGSARLDLVAFDGSVDEIVEEARRLAGASVVPAWAGAPPAAPAKVALADPAIVKRELGAVADSVWKGARRPAGVSVSASAELLREKVVVEGHSGFRAAWDATEVRASALVRSGSRTLEVLREARRLSDLELDDALADAARDLSLLAGAASPTLGPCAVVLGPDALLHGGGFGLWRAFADQADGVRSQRGLARYALGKEVAPGAAAAGEQALSIASDGALDFATGSCPLSDEGVAVRRFSLVERGVAAGLALSPREAALNHADPNGGVRNLMVSLGTWVPSGSDRVLEVVRLRSLSVDAATGDAVLSVELGIERGGASPRVISGGTLRLDAIEALALAQRSAAGIHRGPYSGPASVRIASALLIA